MVVVSAFGTLCGTENAGMTAYYRAPGCTSMTIADILPILSKIVHYEDEYVIGEMLIWDTGSQTGEPNNCVMVRIIVYNDGWICTWFDKTTQNQLAASGLTYVDSMTVSGYGSAIQYPDVLNGMVFEITNNGGDPSTLVGARATIRNSDNTTGRIQLHTNSGIAFHSGYTYSADIYMSNGHLVWYGIDTDDYGRPPTNSNRLYRAIYQVWQQTKSSSNSTNWSHTTASLVYMYDSQTDVYTNETTDFNDVDADDCQVLPTDEVINDAFYIGSSNKFNGVSITMGTPGVGSAITWEYWDGSAWSTLSCVDGSSGFTVTGELTFNPPDNWNKTLVNENDYFWIRARVTTASYAVTPILTQGQLYSQNAIGYLDTELGMYNYEFTGANYILLLGDYGRISVPKLYNYFTVLPGKIIYDSIFNIGVGGACTWGAFYVNDHTIASNLAPSNGCLVYDVLSRIPDVGVQCVIEAYTSSYVYLMSCVVVTS